MRTLAGSIFALVVGGCVVVGPEPDTAYQLNDGGDGSAADAIATMDVGIDASVDQGSLPNIDASVDGTVDAGVPQWFICNSTPESTAGCCGTADYPIVTQIPTGAFFRSKSAAEVFYRGADLKRYRFETNAVLISWHEPFDSAALRSQDATISNVCNRVVMANDDIVARIPLATQTVTFRPGSHPVTITGDPTRVWVISRGRTLHGLKPASLETVIYGSDAANNRQRRLSPTTLPTYVVGGDISSGGSYSPRTEFDNATIESEIAAR